MVKYKQAQLPQNPANPQQLLRHNPYPKLLFLPLICLFNIASLFFPPQVIAGCNITTTPMSFGVYNVYATTNSGSTGQVLVTCNPSTTPYTVGLNGGLYGTISQRLLKRSGGTDNMLYNLYTDASRTTIWGDGTSNGVTVSSSNSTPLTVYGAINSQQDVSTGTYTDSITVTATF